MRRDGTKTTPATGENKMAQNENAKKTTCTDQPGHGTVVDNITPRQKLVIAKGLLDYQYIMDNREKNDDDFQDVYYDFYLKARGEMWNVDHRSVYFELLNGISPETTDLMGILTSLNEKLGSFEFSIGSKMLHTQNPSMPIYDSKVREYLSKKEDVKLWWKIPNRESGARRGTREVEKITHDWDELCKWYDRLLHSSQGEKWINWFDDNFQDFAGISNVKKVDFIIFATN